MTKRKANIFTVIEVVPNWFSASNDNESHQQPIAEGLNHGVIPTAKGLSPNLATIATTAEVPTNLASLGLCTCQPADVAGTEAKWAEGNWDELPPAPWAEFDGSEGAPDRFEGTQTRQGPSEVVTPGINQVTSDLDPLSEEGTAEVERRIQNAFWALLQDAGWYGSGTLPNGPTIRGAIIY